MSPISFWEQSYILLGLHRGPTPKNNKAILKQTSVLGLQNDSSPKQAKLGATPASPSSAGGVVAEQLAIAFDTATTEEQFQSLLGSTEEVVTDA